MVESGREVVQIKVQIQVCHGIWKVDWIGEWYEIRTKRQLQVVEGIVERGHIEQPVVIAGSSKREVEIGGYSVR